MRPNLRTEQEIMKNWKDTKPVVSICCLAYNHEPYIEDALEGFLIQETDFPFEVLIHDDASTDRTPDIIREYEVAYPHIIKPIYQKENQYSKHVRINATFQYPRAQGEYIALCEGDDYWISHLKLITQIKELNKHHEINICFHPAKIYQNQKLTECSIGNHSTQEKIFSLNETIIGDGEFMPTPSILFRKCVIEKLTDFYKTVTTSGVGDLFIQIISANPNGSLYLPNQFSVYRKNTPGSWSERTSNNLHLRLKTNYSIINALSKIKNFITKESIPSIELLQAKYLIETSKTALLIKKYALFTKLYSEATSITSSPIPAKNMLIIKNLHKYPQILSLLIRIKLKLTNI